LTVIELQGDEAMLPHRRPSSLAVAIATLVFWLGVSPAWPCDQCESGKAFRREMREAMSTMDGGMNGAPMSGDPDRDFLAMMIPHHQGAIDMARAVIAHGKDPIVRRLAQEIVTTQQDEILVMERRLPQLPAPPAPVGSPPLVAESASAPVDSVPRTADKRSRDRVYTCDQTSNTVSVIDPSTNGLVGVIRLGDPVPGALSPLYRGQLLVHGAGFAPDHRTLAVVSIASNSVTLIDTTTNVVKGVVYIGRSPHEAFFAPNGKELWATVRGEDYVSVIDPVAMVETRRVKTANGPGMVLFRPDGKFAFVPSSFTPELDVVDTSTYEVVSRVPQASPFSPNVAVSRDGTEVWFTLKDSGKTQVMSAEPPFRILATLETGPLTNHVTLADNENGRFAYVSVGGENAVKVFRRGDPPALVATIPTGDLPHGIWASGDGTRIYLGLENQDQVAAIDALSNTIVARIPVGQQPQALVYVPDAVAEGDGTANLTALGDAGVAAHLSLIVPPGGTGSAHATVSVNSLGLLDLLQIAVSGLQPGQLYTLWMVASRTAPFADKVPLVTFKTNGAGAQVAQAVGPLRQVLIPSSAQAGQSKLRFLMVSAANDDAAQLIQDVQQPSGDRVR
jgi:YVTN family beta-propeller protein